MDEMKLQTKDGRIETTATIICNQNFDYSELLPFQSSYDQQTQLYGYPFQYILSATPDPTLQLTTIQAHATLEGNNEIIFLTNYNEVSLDENGTLLEFIQDLVKAK